MTRMYYEMIEKKLSPEELARRVDASAPTIRKWREGGGRPTLEVAEQISKELGIPANELFQEAELKQAA